MKLEALGESEKCRIEGIAKVVTEMKQARTTHVHIILLSNICKQ